MTLAASRVSRTFYHLLHLSSIHVAASCQTIEERIKTAVASKSYQQIPNLLTASKNSHHSPNPFSFLSTFQLNHRDQIIDEILQSFMSLRPRYHAKPAYDCLLSFALQSSHSFPIALAILQRTLRSGCSPVPQMHLLLSSAWLSYRHQSQSVRNMLLEMRSIGYQPDCGTCNYVIYSLCAVDQLEGAIEVLQGTAMGLLQEMVKKLRLSPRQGMLVKLAASLRANKEICKGADMIQFLEKEGMHVGFECYELVLEGCLECREFLLAGKLAMQMTEKNFIPYINIRTKVFDGLASVGAWELACAVRHRFADLNS